MKLPHESLLVTLFSFFPHPAQMDQEHQGHDYKRFFIMTNLLNKSLKEQGIYKLELLVIKLLCIIRVKCTVYCGAETSHHYDDVTENNGDAPSVHPSSWL